MQNNTEIGLRSLTLPYRAGRVFLMLFAFVLPLTKLLGKYGPVLQVLGVFLFLLFLFDIICYERIAIFSSHITTILIYFVFLSWIIISLLWADNLRIGVRTAFHYAEMFGVFWLSYYFSRYTNNTKYVLSSYTIGILILLIVIVTVQFVIGPDIHPWATSNRRLQLRIINANAVSYILMFAITSVLLISIDSKRIVIKIILFLLLGVFLLGTLLTGTRSIIIALSLAIIPASIYLNKKNIYFLIACIIFSIPVALLISPDPVIRITELFIELSSNGLSILTASSSIKTLNYRLAIWKAGLSLIRSNSLIGVGIGQFEPLVDPVLPRATAPHNAFVETFAELGIIGLLLFFSLLVTVFTSILENLRGQKRPVAVLFIISTVVMMSVTNLLGSAHLWFITGILLSNTKT